MLLPRGLLLILLPSKEKSLWSWLWGSVQLSHSAACSMPLWAVRSMRRAIWLGQSITKGREVPGSKMGELYLLRPVGWLRPLTSSCIRR